MSDLFISPSGGLTELSPEEAANADALGYAVASPEQRKDYDLQQKYGGAASQLATFAESAASSLTFGLSTVAEKALGVEGIKEREEANPVSALAGTVAGVGVPLVATLGGASAYTAPALIAKAGAAAGGAVERGLASYAVPTLGQALAKGAAKAGAAMGVEGALYGAGQVVHEAALGDPNLTAQSIFAQTLGVGLLTGALGAGGSVLGRLVGTGIAKAGPSDFGKRITEFLEGSEGHSNLNATGAKPGQIAKVFTSKGEESATAIGNDARDLGIIQNPFTDSPKGIYSRAEVVAKDATDTINKIAQDASAAGPKTTFEAIRGQVEAPILSALRSEGSTYAVGDEFASLMDRFAKAYEGRALGVADVLAVKRDVGAFIYKNGKVLDPWAKAINEPASRVYGHLDSLVEGGIRDTLGNEAAITWKTANRAAEVAITLKSLAESGIERAATNNAFSLTGTLGMLAGFSHAGIPGSALVGAAAEIARKRGASALGFGARLLRQGLESGSTETLVNKGSAALAAARQADAAATADGAVITRQSPAFKRWFSGSKVVDAEGKPLTVYHGTPDSGFRSFDPESAKGALDSGWLGKGSYFTDRSDIASYYSMSREVGGAPGVYPVHLNLQNPYQWGPKTRDMIGVLQGTEGSMPRDLSDAVLKRAGLSRADIASPDKFMLQDLSSALRKELESRGYDGVVADFPKDGTHEFVSFHPGQIKSALGTTATHDAEDLSIARMHVQRVAVLSRMQEANEAMASRIDSAVSTLVRSGPRASSVGRGEVEAGIAKVHGMSASDRAAEFQRRTDAVSSLVADGDHFAQRIDEHTSDLAHHAPQTAQAMQVVSARAAQFLASKVPHAPPGGGPLAPEWQPSAAQMASYLRYDEAVRHPLSVLKQAAAGTVTPEALEALRVVYPDLLQQMQAATMTALASHKRPSYQARLGISALMGYSMDGTTTPQAVALQQQAFAPKQPPQPHGATPARADKIHISNRYATPGQRSAERGR